MDISVLVNEEGSRGESEVGFRSLTATLKQDFIMKLERIRLYVSVTGTSIP